MIQGLPQEKQWVSWLYVVIWSLIIFVTIPLTRDLQTFVAQHWGSKTFTYAVIVAVLTATAVAIVYLTRQRPTRHDGYFWLFLVAAVFFWYTLKLGKQSPVEAIHFIQYGVLGGLVYRALTYRIQDLSIYFAAAVICGIIGTTDEIIQWLIPGRFWHLMDIWINFFSAACIQVAIALGMKPKFISNRPNRASLRFLCRLTILATALLGTSLINTPSRIAWYAERIPLFAFLMENESVMLEYGYLYNDPEIGRFRSRFGPSDLEQTDRDRAVEAARILNRFKDHTTYKSFLIRYSPVVDAFVHEARVHLFTRDKNFSKSAKYKEFPERYAHFLTHAFRENQIMQNYFAHTLRHSDYVWSEEKIKLARDNLLKDMSYDSAVSSSLITRVSEGQVACFFALAVIGLALLHRYLGKRWPNRN